MKRMWASLAIFIVLIIICELGVNNTQKVSAQTIKTVIAAKEAEQRGDTETAVQLSRKVGQDWQNWHKTLCLYMPHSKLEAISQTLAGLPMLSKYGAKEQFLSECDRSIVQISYLTESELANLANIF